MTYALKIDRQPLDGALQQLAKQTNLQVIYFSRVAEGLAAPGIDGEYTLAAAIEKLLVGTRLTFRVLNEQTVEVRPAQARATDYARRRDRSDDNVARVAVNTLGPRREPDELEEVVVVGLAEQLVATRIATPLREIPQTVSIVPREQIRLQNSTDLADVLSQVPGLTMSRNNSLVRNYYSRGYLIDSLHIDGGAGLNSNLNSAVVFLATPDMSEFDHVEVLRGADALFGGNANPGGTVSLVRKRPQRNAAIDFSILAGEHSGHRVEVDVTGPIRADGALRARGNVVYDREGYFYDVASRERKKIFGALEYDLTAASTLTAGLSYQWEDSTPVVGGLPFYSDGRDSQLPRDFALGFDWSWYRTRVGEAYIQLRQEYSAEWALKVNAAGWRTEAENLYGDIQGTINPVTNHLDRAPQAVASARPNLHKQLTADATITGTLELFGFRQELAIGVDITRIEADAIGHLYSDFAPPLGDVMSFDPSSSRPDVMPYLSVDGGAFQNQKGMFASLRLYFDTDLSVVAGARFSDESHGGTSTIYVGPLSMVVSSRIESDPALKPYAAVMYSIGERYSVYVSYADIFARQGNELLASGRRINAVSGANAEGGIKGEWRQGAVNGSAVVYQIKQRNLPRQIPRPGGNSDPDCCYEEVSSKSSGVDLELSGQIASGWRLGAGYSFNLNEAPTGARLSTITPKHMLKAWTNLRLPGAYRRWELGGSLHAQSVTKSSQIVCFSGCPTIDAVQDAYAVIDLRAGFEIDSNWRVSLSVENVFDKVYYESIDAPPLHGWYGAPRNAVLRIDGRF